jgi:drug/metabolite transporter (DMT)-like permease
MTSYPKPETTGVILAFLAAAFATLFPIVVSKGVQTIPAVTFAGLSVLLAATAAFVYAIFQERLHELKYKKAYRSLLLVAFCIVIIPYLLLFIGAKSTSGINTSILLLSEIIFTIIFTHFIGETTTLYKILGAGNIFIGALFILFHGSFALHSGDLLIIASTALYPIGNFYAKRALNTVSPAIVLFTRFLLGSIFLLLLARLIEPTAHPIQIFFQHPWLILFNGLVILGLGKVIWYEAFQRLDISKAISLIMTYPLFSVLVLVLFFHEKISLPQLVGVAFMLVGVYFSIRRQSVQPHLTKYRAD